MRLVRKAISKRARFRVLSRSGFRCVYCGACASEKRIDVDHVVPVSKGGSDHESNLVAACCDCNLGKSDDLVDAAPPMNAVRPAIDVSANCLLMIKTGVFYQGKFCEFIEPFP